MTNVPGPVEIAAALQRRVLGQEDVVREMSVALSKYLAGLRTGNILKVGLQSILRNTLRSCLTMLGIIIGVACVIAMVAVAGGASQSIQASITSLGTNFIQIFPGAVTQSGARIFTGQSTLTPEDAQAIKAECPAVAYVSAGVRSAGQVAATAAAA